MKIKQDREIIKLQQELKSAINMTESIEQRSSNIEMEHRQLRIKTENQEKQIAYLNEEKAKLEKELAIM